MNGYTPKIQLPFTTAKPFPARAFEPSPERLRMGVEAQARANAPKMPVVNTAVSDRVAALGRNPSVSTPAAPFGQPAAPPAQPVIFGGDVMPQPRAANPLSRGAPAGAASSLGGPVPVGRSRFDPNRMAEMMVRRKDPRGAQFLFGRAMQENSQSFQREMFGAQAAESAARDKTNFEQQQYMFGLQQDANATRDATNFEQQQYMFGLQNEAAQAEYERRRGDEMADQMGRGIESVDAMPVFGGGFVPVVKRRNGTVDMAGGYMPGEKAEPPLPPGMEPIRASRGGVDYAKPGAQKMEKPIISWGEDPQTQQRIPFQQIVDPETGEVVLKKVKIVDADKNGVDDRLQQGAAPAGTPPAGAARTTPGGHSVSRVK